MTEAFVIINDPDECELYFALLKKGEAIANRGKTIEKVSGPFIDHEGKEAWIITTGGMAN